MEKKERITLSLHKSLWKRIQSEAKKQDVSASRLVGLMCEVGLEKLEAETKSLKDRLLG